MTIEQYIDNINKRYHLGNSTEHTFRGDLQQLLETLVPGIRATNEPKRQSCGAPDLDGLKKNGNKEQFDRYKASLGNPILL